MKRHSIIAAAISMMLLSLLVVTGQEDGCTIPDLRDTSDIEADYVSVVDDANPWREITFKVRRTGSTIFLDMQAISGNLDGILLLVDSNGNTLIDNGDRTPDNLDPYLRFPQAAAGEYRIIAGRRRLERGDTCGQFLLNIDIDSNPDILTDVNYRVTPGALADAGYPDMTPRPVADWTVLAYYGADTGLEPDIIVDLHEFELAGGSDDDVHVVGLLDRHPDYYNDPDPDADWSTARLYEITADDGPPPVADEVPTLNSTHLADLNEVNSGNGEKLAQFLTWAIRHYPAENYVLAFASHGAGWQGLILDESEAPDSIVPDFGGADGYAILSVPELRKALEIARQEAGVEKFDLLINDACFMSSIEYFAVMDEFFEMSIASAEIVITPAHNMTLFLDTLKRRSRGPALVSLSKDLVDEYIANLTEQRESSDVLYITSSVTDLNRFDPVTQAVENFATVFNADATTRAIDLAKARTNTYTYSQWAGEEEKIDLGDLMNRLIASSTDEELIEAADDVLQALEQARLYGQSGERAAPYTSHYNIYFPLDRSDFDETYFDETPLGEWSRLLRNYYNFFTPDPWRGSRTEVPFHPPTSPQIRIANVYPQAETASVLNPATFEIEVIGRNVQNGDVTFDLVQDDGTLLRLSEERMLQDVADETGALQRVNIWDAGINQWLGGWDVRLPVVTDGENESHERLIINEDVAFLEGRFRQPGSDTWNDVAVIFPRDGGSAQRVINRVPETGAAAVIDIPEGSDFQAYRYVVTPDGYGLPEPGTLYTWPPGGLIWSMQPAPSGEYRIQFIVTAFAGTQAVEYATVTVDNSVAQNRQAFTRNNIGFSITYPANWDRLVDTGNSYYQTLSPDRLARQRLYILSLYTDLDAPTPEDFMLDLEFWFPEIQPTTDMQPIMAGGVESQQIDYVIETEDGETVTGRGLVTFNGEYTLFYGVELLPDAPYTLDELFVPMAETVVLYEPIRANFLWRIAPLFEWQSQAEALLEMGYPLELRYPLPAGWAEFARFNGRWLQFTPAMPVGPEELPAYDPEVTDEDGNISAPDSLTFFAVTQFEIRSDLLDSRSILTGLATGDIIAQVDDLQLRGENTLFGQNLTWNAITYEAQRYGYPITGRVYTTTANNRVYAVWMETPITGAENDIINNTLEIVVDGADILPLPPPEA